MQEQDFFHNALQVRVRFDQNGKNVSYKALVSLKKRAFLPFL